MDCSACWRAFSNGLGWFALIFAPGPFWGFGFYAKSLVNRKSKYEFDGLYDSLEADPVIMPGCQIHDAMFDKVSVTHLLSLRSLSLPLGGRPGSVHLRRRICEWGGRLWSRRETCGARRRCCRRIEFLDYLLIGLLYFYHLSRRQFLSSRVLVRMPAQGKDFVPPSYILDRGARWNTQNRPGQRHIEAEVFSFSGILSEVRAWTAPGYLQQIDEVSRNDGENQ